MGITNSTVGLIGLGAMGEAIGERLLERGQDLVVFNRSQGAVDRLVERGAAAAASPADLAHRSSAILTVLPEGSDVLKVLDGPEGALAAAATGTLVIDCSTIEPRISRTLAVASAARGLRFSDAGVGGLPPDARAGRLTFMYGAAEEDAADIERTLAPLAAAFWFCGPPGSGMTAKVINNLLATAIHVADLEAVVLAERAGIDLAVLFQIMQATMADNRQLRDRIPAELVDQAHAPGFKVDLAQRVVSIGCALGDEFGVPLDVLCAGRLLLEEAQERGYGALGVSALLPALRGRVGANLPPSGPR